MTETTATAEPLTPDLVDRVMRLAPADKDQLRDMLDDENMPPDPRSDDEIAALIRERSDDFHAGRSVSLTVEESNARIRGAIRKLGFELP